MSIFYSFMIYGMILFAFLWFYVSVKHFELPGVQIVLYK